MPDDTAKKDELKELDSLSEAIEALPEEDRGDIVKLVMMSLQLGNMSPQHELMKRLTPDNISQFIESKNKADEILLQESKDTKKYNIIILFGFFAFILVLISMLKNNSDILEKILYSLISLIAGMAGGYGYAKTKQD